MEHAVREEQNGLVVSLSGDVDLDSSPRAREVLLDCVGRKTRVVVDLSEVEQPTSSIEVGCGVVSVQGDRPLQDEQRALEITELRLRHRLEIVPARL